MELTLQNLTKSFGPKTVLRDVSLTAHTGYCVGVLGRNGAGKSTLFNLLTNALLPSKGAIVLDGEPLGETFPVAAKRRMGALVNQGYLVEQLTAEEYLQFVARIYGLPAAQAHIDSLLAHLLEEYDSVRTKRLSSFSTGMKQRVAIASCLLHRPELLILDEPFNGLDVFAAERVLSLLNSYRPQALTFVSSHNLAHIEKVATHLLVIDDSEVKYWGSMEDFLQGQRAFLGDALLQLIHPAAQTAQDLTWLTTQR
ncbi:ABC transporter ATP-binding protein [Hymenobacter sp. BT770]|uniref:ABC transporter ATP-binding protein n=1 Tax=Hymenobacter sp. BT770 TaxID=2886942 RepID=UPI001D11CB9D|nr:ABC transporter ATP-binding protein [Hymenobacter sp. BT770]MCC3154805.1 ABC transporter ATP-binding protein [Hymenobacter sp. BT770]MDO3416820.1 ABC transporter ATP-binding protein [Hymenobacter sp. BT770]